jgi:hypothetical protein
MRKKRKGVLLRFFASSSLLPFLRSKKGRSSEEETNLTETTDLFKI